MKKKIKDFTLEEVEKICKCHLCEECPLNYKLCSQGLITFCCYNDLEQEIEVEDYE